jgi:hypothetical protein
MAIFISERETKMRKLVRYISAPHQEYQSLEDDTLIWVGGGHQGALFTDAIIGFEALGWCNEDACTEILLITGKSRRVMGSIDEWIQRMNETCSES